MKELDPSLYKNKVENPKETVYEIITAEDDLSWGLAIADIGKSEPHIHHKSKEVYVVSEGKLKLVLGEKSYELGVGETITIPPKTKHWAESLGEQQARVLCLSFPAWTPEDHKIIQKDI